jgi:glycosyltransferase involved in cell wall biosynthesis
MGRYLWLTLCHPDPQTNGQFLYSGGLVRAVASTGAQVAALGLLRSDTPSPRAEANIEWTLAADLPASRLWRAMSLFPLHAQRTRVPALRAHLARYLKPPGWNAIVLDSITVGWALPQVLAYRRRFPAVKILYLAQNVETAAALALARPEKKVVRRILRFADAAKTHALERRLVTSCDVVTADAPEDCQQLASLRPGKPVYFLPPGYSGARVAARRIDHRTPRRAVVLGSFDWPAKRLSIEAFLSASAALFHCNGISLQVIGRTEPRYVSALRQRFPSVEVLGTVSDVAPFLANARVALVPDTLGGFKMKTLDYIFNRIPIFAIDGSAPGTPLRDGFGLRLFRNHHELAEGVIEAIDDLANLNAQQQIAYSLCARRFNWDIIGKDLVALIARPPPLSESPGWIAGAALAAYRC